MKPEAGGLGQRRCRAAMAAAMRDSWQRAHDVSPQFLDPASGNLTDVKSSAPAYNNVSGVCSNAVQYVNITCFYRITNDAATTSPGTLERVWPLLARHVVSGQSGNLVWMQA
jgi:hypothetical protein